MAAAAVNPYEAPQAPLEVEAVADTVPLYSPGQVAFGIFLGGPLPGIHFLASNYRALDQGRKAWITWGLGLAFTVLLAGLVVVLPAWVPSYLLPVLMALGGRWIAASLQGAGAYPRHGHGRAVGFALLGLVLTLALVVLVITLFFMAGWIPEA